VYRRAAYGRQANSHALFKALLLAAFAIHTKSVLWKRLRRTFGLAAPPQHWQLLSRTRGTVFN